MSRIIAAALLAGLASGCSSSLPQMRLPATLNAGEVILSVSPKIEAGRTIQAVVNPYAPANVDHMTVALSKFVAGAYLRLSIP